jgi:hypothetical protein
VVVVVVVFVGRITDCGSKVYELHYKNWFSLLAIWKLFPPKLNTSATYTAYKFVLFPM